MVTDLDVLLDHELTFESSRPYSFLNLCFVHQICLRYIS
ncbi:proline-rich receptor-like protein kinase PERK8 [Iris pallida]|uniref:Proline-rich receptor-like protein kinase PERK8 n=1 Tax=Iris pallida TaxID=29817 RepID=A0AAX6I103_IRIPA|nr:proline-rich receptor-like protein kinase PERK8 [Iris pallida]